ncbi:hypothetical protein C0431_01515 [bacterium]|nr:hypothetical protein [bacterium]
MKFLPVILTVTTACAAGAVPHSRIDSEKSQPEKILPIQNTRSVNQAYLRPLPLGPLLRPGQNQTSWLLGIENEFRVNQTIREDGESWRLRYLYRHASEQGEWLISIPLIHRGGGLLDSFIDLWHQNVVNHSAPNREITPYGRNRYILHDGSRPSPGTNLGDLTTGYRFRLPASPQISIKLPTGNPGQLLGSGGTDLAFSCEQTWSIAPRYDFTAQASLIYQSPSSGWTATRPWIATYNLALAYRITEHQSWILQLTSETPAVQNDEPFLDQPNRIISLGLSQSTKAGTWTFWISEDGDIGWFNLNRGVTTGADFAIGIRFTQKQ